MLLQISSQRQSKKKLNSDQNNIKLTLNLLANQTKQNKTSTGRKI